MNEITLPMTGGCLCGAVRYETTEPPTDVMYCHCKMCQRWSSGAMTITAKFPAKAVTFKQGQPKIHKSSERGRRGFCDDCGSHLTFQYLVTDPGIGSDLVLETGMIYIPVGTFDNAEDISPSSHFWIDSKLSWLNIDDELPRHGSGSLKNGRT